VLAALCDAPATADELARATGLPAADVAALLVELELDGRVSSEDGVYRATIAA
jgi:predicted Rossmann fold nucleotide-binding protein DprA/Smf involved in DNA uptake